MMKPETKRSVAIEDLLRLKRAERPPTDFWSQFDRELRAKQLSALMARRPWWQRVPSPSRFFVRHRILLGTSAVLAVTLVSVRSVRVTSPESVTVNAVTSADAPQSPMLPAATPVIAVADENRSPVTRMAEISHAATSTSAQVFAAVKTATTVTVVEQSFSPAALVAPAATSDVAPAAPRHFLSGLVATVAPEIPSSRKLGAGFEAHPTAARAAVEPLHQITPPSESRRARLLTAMVSMAALGTSSSNSERVASRIDEDRLYDQVSRFAAKGDRLNVKF